MLDQSFSAKNLTYLREVDDESRFHIKRGSIDTRISSLASTLEADAFDPIPFIKIEKPKFDLYVTNNFENALILRKINDNLRRLYKVKQADRSEIVHQVAVMLRETTPKHILKLDIKSFYESINCKAVLQKINDDHLLSYRSKLLLSKYFSSCFPGLKWGLPRGLNLSATFSEIFMREFDAKVKAIDGVYYYSRYVDDIIVFTHEEPHHIKERIIALLPSGLRLNKEKSNSIFSVKCRCKPICKCVNNCRCKTGCKCPSSPDRWHEMEFLGYAFKFSDVNTSQPGKKNEVYITIARKKVNKIKRRVILSILSHLKKPDFHLLNDRIRFLTSNFTIKDTKKNSEIKMGIYYNYKLITSPPGKDPTLKELDIFLRTAVLNEKSSFGRKVASGLVPSEKATLAKYSFISGQRTRRTINFTTDRINQITRCWKHE